MNRMKMMASLVGLMMAAALPIFAAEPMLESEWIFPPEHWHNHASCVVEQPNGDLLVCWFHGSGERTADDVAILGSRKVKGESAWQKPFVMADIPGFPDTNCCMFIEPSGRLWLIWPTIMANLWETALLNIRYSTDYQDQPSEAPHWNWQEVLHVKPGDAFADTVRQALDHYAESHTPLDGRSQGYLTEIRRRADDKYFRRMGWMTRAHPTLLPSGRLIVPLYSDGFSFSLMALTDDWGKTWQFSTPLVGGGNIQPSIARKKDGMLVAIMRDNGPAPKRAHLSESTDDGLTWSQVHDSEIPNPGAGLEWIVLQSGEWLLIYNDTEKGRNRLALSLSEDEGATWKWSRYLEKHENEDAQYHYPSIMQAKDGTLHATYSYFGPSAELGENRKTIKHAHFNLDWIKAGESTAP